jgi:hypothetical protein
MTRIYNVHCALDALCCCFRPIFQSLAHHVGHGRPDFVLNVRRLAYVLRKITHSASFDLIGIDLDPLHLSRSRLNFWLELDWRV